MRAINHCPKGLSKDNMTAISAPYNFVPLNRRVHVPAWASQVSHDWPFQDGLSGEIHYTLTADSPVLVGGRQEKHDHPDRPNTEVHPFRLPDGRYAIPGSSLKGMLRAVVEIATFGRMRMVDEVRPGLRDISGKYVTASYTEKVRNRVKTGFLRRRPDGGQEIVPCKMVRVSHRELESALKVKKPIFKARITVREKYRIWEKHCQRNHWTSDEIRFDISGHEAVNLGQGNYTGFPVFTGQISDSTQKKGKYKDFIFYSEENRAIAVSNESWRDFLRIHGEEDGKPDMPWPGYWRRKFRKGKAVPVFYVQDGNLLRIGLAYMPKLAGDFTTHDLIRHANAQHFDAPGEEKGYDMADLLFGALGARQDDALRGRVSCETAIAEAIPEPEQPPDTILNGPKPSYFPNYIEQPTRDGIHLSDEQYRTYMDTGGSKPVIRGFKRYPARPRDKVGVQQLQPDQTANKRVQVRLHPLPAGTRFKGRIVFHNLKPEELGALLWAVTWGGDTSLRHALGMGKPFGFGQVHFDIDEDDSRLIPNDPRSTAPTISELIARFKDYMNRQIPDSEWEETPQIKNLFAMADPASADALPEGMALRHMCLKVNEFTWAKQKGLVLQDYADAVGWPTPAVLERYRQRASEQTQKQLAQSGLHPWLREQLQTLLSDTHATDLEALMRHKKLFQAWDRLNDAALKREVFEAIRAFWQQEGWWEQPETRSMRKLRDDYQRKYDRLEKSS